MKAKDQAAALQMIDSDPGLHDLRHLRGPYLDLEASAVAPLCGMRVLSLKFESEVCLQRGSGFGGKVVWFMMVALGSRRGCAAACWRPRAGPEADAG